MPTQPSALLTRTPACLTAPALQLHQPATGDRGLPQRAAAHAAAAAAVAAQRAASYGCHCGAAPPPACHSQPHLPASKLGGAVGAWQPSAAMRLNCCIQPRLLSCLMAPPMRPCFAAHDHEHARHGCGHHTPVPLQIRDHRHVRQRTGRAMCCSVLGAANCPRLHIHGAWQVHALRAAASSHHSCLTCLLIRPPLPPVGTSLRSGRSRARCSSRPTRQPTLLPQT